jgi:hypothetical protein
MSNELASQIANIGTWASLAWFFAGMVVGMGLIIYSQKKGGRK